MERCFGVPPNTLGCLLTTSAAAAAGNDDSDNEADSCDNEVPTAAAATAEVTDH